MLYPVKNIDRVSWAIVGAPILPHIARDLVFGNTDRQNPPECPRSHDPKPSPIDTLPIAPKRPTSQFSPIPELFPRILDAPVLILQHKQAPAQGALCSGTAPIWNADLAPAPRRSVPRSTHQKPLKKCSGAKSNTDQKITEKISGRQKFPTFFENAFSSGSIFGLGLARVGARAHI